MSRDIAPFGLRMPLELRQACEKSAKFNGRSLNSEIVFQLRNAYLSEFTAELDDENKTDQR